MGEEKVKYPKLDNCNPTTCISGNMMKCNRIIANIFRKHLKPFEITDSQLSMLFVITKAQEVTQQKLASLLFMEKSTVNRNIVRLIDKKYVAMDGRMLHTTEGGKKFLEIVIPHWELAMNETKNILKGEGADALNILLSKLMQ